MKFFFPKYQIQILIMIFLLGISTAYSQDVSKGNSFGISALVQDSQFDILFPIPTSELVVVAPAIGFLYASEAGIDISFGMVARFYLNNNIVRPFLGARAGLIYFNPASPDGDGQSEPESTTDYLVGFLAGGEYFINDSFSFGIEAQLNSTISDENSSRFGNPGGININTGAAVFATVYF